MESATLTRPRPVAAPASESDAERSRRWPRVAFLLLCAGALWGFLAFPTYPNYDSYYSLLWGREILDGHLPSYDAYRAPTPHPLPILVGVLLDPLGHVAERLWILLCVASFVALVAGVFRLARDSFTALVGLVAALLLISRFDFAFYAARGYVDIAYMAFVVWAAVLALRTPRPHLRVLGLLAVAGMLRPEAWLMSGLYFLYAARHASWPDRVKLAALTALAPVVWAGSDWIVTGDPLWSLTYTSAFAEELDRSGSAGSLLPALWEFLVKLDKLPIVIAGIVGAGLAVVATPRRSVVPLTLLGVGVGTFLLVGLGGFSLIDRYLLVASMVLIVFAGVALAGFTLLEEGSRLRRGWAIAAGVVAVAGAVYTVVMVDPGRLQRELEFRGQSHVALHAILTDERVERAIGRCGPVSVPNHKLIPDVRYILDLPDRAVLARSEALAKPKGPAARRRARRVARRIARGGVAIYPHQRAALFRQALVEDTDITATQQPLAGYERVAVSSYYSAYVRC